MSVIQKIRDKYARVAVIAIAVALTGFILTDYISGKSRNLFSGSDSNTVGRVNGKRIDLTSFLTKVNQQEDYQKSQGYFPPGDAGRQQIIESVWNQEVERILMNSEISKMGMLVGKRELNDLLFGANPPADIKRIGTDPETGIYDPAKAQQAINNVKKNGTQEAKDQFSVYINEMEHLRLVDKYNSLLTNSNNYPRWLLEKQNADNSLMAKASMVREVYSSIPDSSIKISDQEISDYINKHKEDYKQQENRSISYVSFSALPTAGDTIAIRNQVLALKPEFDTTHRASDFLSSNSSAIAFFDGYTGKSQMQMAAKDSIQALSQNGVFGPYPDAGNFVLAKLLEVKTLPDSVKCRHILIGTVDPQTKKPLTEDSVAHRTADSVALSIKNGANFDSLETKFTTDKEAHKNKGVMTFSSTDIQGENFAKEFGQFILFDGKPGDKKVVKTSFGWHYIEILSFIKPELQFKVAYMAKQVVASKETDDNASNQANLFAGDSRDAKAFDANYEKTLKPKGINKAIATDIAPNAYEVQRMPSRIFVKELYKAKLGEVLQPMHIGDEYVVAVVTEINKEGIQTVAKARNSIEPVLRNKKKAELIKQKVGKVTTLEAAATALGKEIELADSLRMTTGSKASKMGYEPRVNGAVFNPANKGKVIAEPLEGVSGVYVLRVDTVSATAISDANVSTQRKTMYQQAKQNSMYNNPVITALKNAATISDKRAGLQQL